MSERTTSSIRTSTSSELRNSIIVSLTAITAAVFAGSAAWVFLKRNEYKKLSRNRAPRRIAAVDLKNKQNYGKPRGNKSFPADSPFHRRSLAASSAALVHGFQATGNEIAGRQQQPPTAELHGGGKALGLQERKIETLPTVSSDHVSGCRFRSCNSQSYAWASSDRNSSFYSSHGIDSKMQFHSRAHDAAHSRPLASSCKQAWDAIEADFPAADSSLKVQDIDLCTDIGGGLLKLGKGSFGTVYKALKGGVHPVAVKVIAFDATDEQRANFLNEVRILESCRDRNVVQFLGSCTIRNQTVLVTEFMENGDLLHAINGDADGSLRWPNRRPSSTAECSISGRGKHIALCIARGLAFLHTNRIVHLDIKSPNVLLDKDYEAKIADVGFAKLQLKDYLSTANTGTFAWSACSSAHPLLAPEILMGDRCSEKVDIFSFGVVLWEILTGEKPIRGRLREIGPHECPLAVRQLVEQCMDSNPSGRPSAMDIVQLLSQPDSVLESGTAPQAAPPIATQGPDEESPSDSRCQRLRQITSQLALLVYGSEEAIEQKGWTPAEHSNIAKKVDLGLWQDYVKTLPRLLRDDSIDDVTSPAYKRLLAMGLLVSEVFRLKLEDNPRWLSSVQAVTSTTTVDLPGIDSNRHSKMLQVMDVLQLTELQRNRICERQERLLEEESSILLNRQQLLQALEGFSAAGDNLPTMAANADAMRVAVDLQASFRQQYEVTNDAFMSVLAVLMPLQQAKFAVECRPLVWDPLVLAAVVHNQNGAAAPTGGNTTCLGSMQAGGQGSQEACLRSMSPTADRGRPEVARCVSLESYLKVATS